MVGHTADIGGCAQLGVRSLTRCSRGAHRGQFSILLPHDLFMVTIELSSQNS
jgi:hypothetical protein